MLQRIQSIEWFLMKALTVISNEQNKLSDEQHCLLFEQLGQGGYNHSTSITTKGVKFLYN